MHTITLNAPLRDRNTFGMDVSAAVVAEYDTPDDLRLLLADDRIKGRPFWHIGRGSNLLFTADYDGVVFHSRIGGIDIVGDADGDGSVRVRAGSGVVWDDLVAWAVDHDLGGIENLSAIPGEVGAAAVQNIGAYGVEVADVVAAVETLDTTTGDIRTFAPQECAYAYRDSIFKRSDHKSRYIITHVELALRRGGAPNLEYAGLRAALADIAAPTLADVRRAVVAIRAAKLPDTAVLGNAGSFFKNPVVGRRMFEELRHVYPDIPHYDIPSGDTSSARVKIPAGWLIEQCGWRGRGIGDAAVYERQCLVIVNRGHATPSDIVRLKDAIVRTVDERFGITIEPEVNII